MGVIEFIEKLQRKPEASRKKILWLILFVIMGVIIAIWLTTFNLGPAEEQIKKSGGPFDFIRQDIKDFYGFFKTAANNFKKQDIVDFYGFIKNITK